MATWRKVTGGKGGFPADRPISKAGSPLPATGKGAGSPPPKETFTFGPGPVNTTRTTRPPYDAPAPKRTGPTSGSPPPKPQKATVNPGPKAQTPKVGYARGPKTNAGAAMPRPVRRRKQKGI